MPTGYNAKISFSECDLPASAASFSIEPAEIRYVNMKNELQQALKRLKRWAGQTGRSNRAQKCKRARKAILEEVKAWLSGIHITAFTVCPLCQNNPRQSKTHLETARHLADSHTRELGHGPKVREELIKAAVIGASKQAFGEPKLDVFSEAMRNEFAKAWQRIDP
jgi:undecaprenyl pyrophosphate synthase